MSIRKTLMGLMDRFEDLGMWVNEDGKVDPDMAQHMYNLISPQFLEMINQAQVDKLKPKEIQSQISDAIKGMNLEKQPHFRDGIKVFIELVEKDEILQFGDNKHTFLNALGEAVGLEMKTATAAKTSGKRFTLLKSRDENIKKSAAVDIKQPEDRLSRRATTKKENKASSAPADNRLSDSVKNERVDKLRSRTSSRSNIFRATTSKKASSSPTIPSANIAQTVENSLKRDLKSVFTNIVNNAGANANATSGFDKSMNSSGINALQKIKEIITTQGIAKKLEPEKIKEILRELIVEIQKNAEIQKNDKPKGHDVVTMNGLEHIVKYIQESDISEYIRVIIELTGYKPKPAPTVQKESDQVANAELPVESTLEPVSQEMTIELQESVDLSSSQAVKPADTLENMKSSYTITLEIQYIFDDHEKLISELVTEINTALDSGEQPSEILKVLHDATETWLKNHNQKEDAIRFLSDLSSYVQENSEKMPVELTDYLSDISNIVENFLPKETVNETSTREFEKAPVLSTITTEIDRSDTQTASPEQTQPIVESNLPPEEKKFEEKIKSLLNNEVLLLGSRSDSNYSPDEANAVVHKYNKIINDALNGESKLSIDTVNRILDECKAKIEQEPKIIKGIDRVSTSTDVNDSFKRLTAENPSIVGEEEKKSTEIQDDLKKLLYDKIVFISKAQETFPTQIHQFIKDAERTFQEILKKADELGLHDDIVNEQISEIIRECAPEIRDHLANGIALFSEMKEEGTPGFSYVSTMREETTEVYLAQQERQYQAINDMNNQLDSLFKIEIAFLGDPERTEFLNDVEYKNILLNNLAKKFQKIISTAKESNLNMNQIESLFGDAVQRLYDSSTNNENSLNGLKYFLKEIDSYYKQAIANKLVGSLDKYHMDHIQRSLNAKINENEAELNKQKSVTQASTAPIPESDVHAQQRSIVEMTGELEGTTSSSKTPTTPLPMTSDIEKKLKSLILNEISNFAGIDKSKRRISTINYVDTPKKRFQQIINAGRDNNLTDSEIQDIIKNVMKSFDIKDGSTQAIMKGIVDFVENIPGNQLTDEYRLMKAEAEGMLKTISSMRRSSTLTESVLDVLTPNIPLPNIPMESTEQKTLSVMQESASDTESSEKQSTSSENISKKERQKELDKQNISNFILEVFDEYGSKTNIDIKEMRDNLNKLKPMTVIESFLSAARSFEYMELRELMWNISEIKPDDQNKENKAMALMKFVELIREDLKNAGILKVLGKTNMINDCCEIMLANADKILNPPTIEMAPPVEMKSASTTTGTTQSYQSAQTDVSTEEVSETTIKDFRVAVQNMLNDRIQTYGDINPENESGLIRAARGALDRFQKIAERYGLHTDQNASIITDTVKNYFAENQGNLEKINSLINGVFKLDDETFKSLKGASLTFLNAMVAQLEEAAKHTAIKEEASIEDMALSTVSGLDTQTIMPTAAVADSNVVENISETLGPEISAPSPVITEAIQKDETNEEKFNQELASLFTQELTFLGNPRNVTILENADFKEKLLQITVNKFQKMIKESGLKDSEIVDRIEGAIQNQSNDNINHGIMYLVAQVMQLNEQANDAGNNPIITIDDNGMNLLKFMQKYAEENVTPKESAPSPPAFDQAPDEPVPHPPLSEQTATIKGATEGAGYEIDTADPNAAPLEEFYAFIEDDSMHLDIDQSMESKYEPEAIPEPIEPITPSTAQVTSPISEPVITPPITAPIPAARKPEISGPISVTKKITEAVAASRHPNAKVMDILKILNIEPWDNAVKKLSELQQQAGKSNNELELLRKYLDPANVMHKLINATPKEKGWVGEHLSVLNWAREQLKLQNSSSAKLATNNKTIPVKYYELLKLIEKTASQEDSLLKSRNKGLIRDLIAEIRPHIIIKPAESLPSNTQITAPAAKQATTVQPAPSRTQLSTPPRTLPDIQPTIPTARPQSTADKAKTTTINVNDEKKFAPEDIITACRAVSLTAQKATPPLSRSVIISVQSDIEDSNKKQTSKVTVSCHTAGGFDIKLSASNPQQLSATVDAAVKLTLKAAPNSVVTINDGTQEQRDAAFKECVKNNIAVENWTTKDSSPTMQDLVKKNTELLSQRAPKAADAPHEDREMRRD